MDDINNSNIDNKDETKDYKLHNEDLLSENIQSDLQNVTLNCETSINYGSNTSEVSVTKEQDRPSKDEIDKSLNTEPTHLKPSLKFTHLKIVTGYWNEFCPEKESKFDEVFFKGCKWSPDGTCLLTNSNNLKIRLFDLPLALYNCHQLIQTEFLDLKSSVGIKMGGQVYDFSWYPLMTSDSPETCCFLTTSFRTPVQLWDAYTGTLRCSYRGYNLQDELEAALSATFHPSGDFLLCGYKDSVKIFDTDIPGRDFFTISTKVTCEQRGLVSCIDVNPSMRNIFAAGTYSKSIGLYSTDGHAICLLAGQSGGVTQVMFSEEGSQLISAGRKDSEILCWDLRQLGKLLWVAKRPHCTNQRIYMDLSADEHYLLSGSTDGHVYVWDLKSACAADSTSETRVLDPVAKWKAHNDCVNGLSVHRHIPIIATASGQRYVPGLIENDDDELFIADRRSVKREDCIKLWWAGNLGEEPDKPLCK